MTDNLEEGCFHLQNCRSTVIFNRASKFDYWVPLILQGLQHLRARCGTLPGVLMSPGVRDSHILSAHIFRRVFLNRDLIRSVHGVLRARSPSGLSKAALIDRS